MERTSGKRKIEWEIPLLTRLSDPLLDASGTCGNGSGDLGDCTHGSDAAGACGNGFGAKAVD